MEENARKTNAAIRMGKGFGVGLRLGRSDWDLLGIRLPELLRLRYMNYMSFIKRFTDFNGMVYYEIEVFESQSEVNNNHQGDDK
jgi:hypothetical protein